MNLSKEYILNVSNETHYLKHNLEKVMWLLEILNFIFSKSSFKNKVVLKGGTAINLAYTNMKRLSVDIDLDYRGSLDKDVAKLDRKIILDEIDNYMKQQKYSISDRSRENTILTSRIYSFTNAFGNNDNIKLDINFIDRIHLYPTNISTVNYFGNETTIVTPSKEELYGMKISALINRSKPRDLYDVCHLFMNIDDVDVALLKRCSIFYLSLDREFRIDELSFGKIKAITYDKIRKEILPVISKDERFELEQSKSFVVKMLQNLFTLTQNEKEYLEQFSKGNYKPELLFDGDVVERAAKHPMAKWICSTVHKNN